MKFFSIAILTFLIIGCQEYQCHDSVRILSPPSDITSVTLREQICSTSAKLEIKDKDQHIVAICRCIRISDVSK